MLESLNIAQNLIGRYDVPLKPQYDPVRMDNIKRKVELLLPDENFYFYNTVGQNLNSVWPWLWVIFPPSGYCKTLQQRRANHQF